MKTKPVHEKAKKIQLSKIGRRRGELTELGKQLIANIGDSIFELTDRKYLLYHALKQITPISKSLKLDDASIEKACEKVIKHLGLNREAKMSVSTDSGFKEIKSKARSNADKFCEYVLGIDKAPGRSYKLLLSQVNNDLKEISDLIKWYEAQPCIQKYINANEVPKSHSDRIIFDFYKRCIKERVVIFNYQLFGVKERSINKCRHTYGLYKDVFIFSEMFNDRPYYFARPFSIHYFDCRKIDVAGHRIRNVTIDEVEIMQDIYVRNKAKFYKIYFKGIPIEQHFKNFNFHLPFLPLSKNRKLIFDELIRLFKARRWISFYALALPQVEGLFSEMCFVISDEEHLSQKSLTDKVNYVRPFHYMSGSYFDYYQYHIPLQRNKFSHTGYDEDFKLKSYDLLVDLSHLLEVFYELDNPLVKINKLHKRKNFQDFISVKEFVDYFKLLEALKPKQKKEIKNNIDTFEKEFLVLNCNVDYICYSIMQDLQKQLDDFISNLNGFYSGLHSKIEFEKLKISDINNLLKDEKQLETLTSCFLYRSEGAEILCSYADFISRHKKHLPSLRPEISKELDRIQKESGLLLKNIAYTDNKIRKQNRSNEENT